MSYATLEEAWGPNFNTKKKKSRKEKRLEVQEQKMLQEAVDPNIVIPKIADIRQKNASLSVPMEQLDSFNGYDRYSDRHGSPFKRGNGGINVTENDILENNKRIEQRYYQQMGQQSNSHQQPKQKIQQPNLQTQLGVSAKEELNKMIRIPEEKYHQMLEGFQNTTDEQFNQLILYIFTGIFYLFLLDMMYQLGKKSY
jgi:hypothetical protein